MLDSSIRINSLQQWVLTLDNSTHCKKSCFKLLALLCCSVRLLLGSTKKGSLETTLQCFSTNMDMADPIKCPEWVLTLDNSTNPKAKTPRRQRLGRKKA